jgi:membrane associated rhomboid family serine protease
MFVKRLLFVKRLQTRTRAFPAVRSYSGTSRFSLSALGPLPVTMIIAANVSICGFYLYSQSSSIAVKRLYDEWFILSSSRIQKRPIVLLTSMFTHLDPIHLLVNMFSLHSFGGTAYSMLGGPRFIGLYIASGLAGGLAQIQYNRYMPTTTFPSSVSVRRNDAAVGASAAISGVVLYYATRVPQGEISIFIFPVPNPAFILFFVFGSLYFSLYSPERSHWAHAGHLGGAGVGIGYALYRRLLRK